MKDLPEVESFNMQPRMMMAGGGLTAAAIAAGRNLPGRAKDLVNKIFGKDKKTLKDMLKEEGRYYGFDDADDFLKYIDKNAIEAGKRRVPFEGSGFVGKPANLYQVFKNKEIRNRNIPGTASLNNRLRRGTENAIIGGGGLGVAGAIDSTQGFTEQAKMQNMMLSSPEQFGKDLARMKIGAEKLIELASQKAQEIGAPITEYVGRAQRSYEDEMEAERMQQIDAEQGLKNVSLFMSKGDEVDVSKLPPNLLSMYKSGPTGKKGVENIAAKTDKFAEGDEVNMMLMEMESADDEVMPTEASVDEGMMELEGMQPAMQMLDQYVQQVVQMIQAGASEQEVIEMLMQTGLDEEDINAVFQAVLELLQSSMQANPIDDQLAQIS